MKVGFVTFGCRLNRAEALELEERYATDGWEIVSVEKHGGEPPDRIVVRGCAVTAKAQRDCEKAIAHLRNRFPRTDIRITGCLPEAQPRPPADAAQANAATVGRADVSRAYLKVQDGCSGACTYCIVPQFRGAPVSRPFADVLSRARAFLDAGFRELVVTGCNLCLYHDAGRGLPELAAALAELESPGHRIRLGSIEPALCDDRLLEVLEAHPNICRFLHLAVQSGSNRILHRMRRPCTAERMAAFCAEARRRLGPRLALGADVIAGFPGETETDHAATRTFLAEGFIHLHAFPYSERPETEAATMTPSVPVAVRRQRAKELEQIVAANRNAFAKTLIGQRVSVCVEKDGNGRTDEYLRCELIGRAARRSIVMAMVKDYFPKTDVISATIRTNEKEGGQQP